MSSTHLHDILLSRDEVAQLRTLIAADAGAADLARRIILAPARRAIAQPLVIPEPTAASQPHNFDPATGSPLAYDPREPVHHRSEAGAPLEGDGFDAAWATITHNLNASAARDCALAAALFDDAEAARHARDILLRYAKVYLLRPPRGKLSCTWGRIHNSALEEAVWGVSLVWAAQLLDQIGALDGHDLDTLRENLFEPIVDLLWGEWYFIHNIRMWHNAAIGCIGLAFADRASKREAIHGSMGFRQQLIDGFRADGLLYEGSPGYHGYALGAVVCLAEAMARNGYEPYRDDHLRQILLAPVRLMQPDGSIPALNDYHRVKTLPTRIYGTALHRYGDDAEVRAAAGLAFRQWREAGFTHDRSASRWNCSTAYFARQQVDWLLAWDRIDETLTPRLPRVTAMTPSGIGVLRPRGGDYLLLKCSTKGSGHDHHDKLSLVWWRGGKMWLTDMGTTSYQHDLHENWFKHTLSHNTVIVDGRKQERCDAALTTCTETELAGEAKPYPQAMPDIVMARRVSVTDDGLHDSMTVTCDRVRAVDYVLRPLGRLQLPHDAVAEPAELSGGDAAYDVLTGVRRIAWGEARRLAWRQGDELLVVDLADLDAATECWIARAPMNTTDFADLGDMLILRLHAAASSFDVSLRMQPIHAAADDAGRMPAAANRT